jgi:hypothetical protein
MAVDRGGQCMQRHDPCHNCGRRPKATADQSRIRPRRLPHRRDLCYHFAPRHAIGSIVVLMALFSRGAAILGGPADVAGDLFGQRHRRIGDGCGADLDVDDHIELGGQRPLAVSSGVAHERAGSQHFPLLGDI